MSRDDEVQNTFGRVITSRLYPHDAPFMCLALDRAAGHGVISGCEAEVAKNAIREYLAELTHTKVTPSAAQGCLATALYRRYAETGRPQVDSFAEATDPRRVYQRRRPRPQDVWGDHLDAAKYLTGPIFRDWPHRPRTTEEVAEHIEGACEKFAEATLQKQAYIAPANITEAILYIDEAVSIPLSAWLRAPAKIAPDDPHDPVPSN